MDLYSEAVIGEVLKSIAATIKINGNIVNNVRFDEDTVEIASLRELQLFMSLIVKHSVHFGLQMNIAKAKLMLFSTYRP